VAPVASGAVTPPPVRARFAPSPTGYLHIGGARTALFNWLFARGRGGELLLRIEDTDAERSRPELIDVIYRALEWLGIDWDGAPVHQSDRAELYREATDRLLGSGSAYWCDCTPGDVKARAEARGGKPGYDGHCRDRGLGPGPGRVVRFRTPREGATAFDDVVRGPISFENAELEDFVVVRSTGVPLFLVANAVDDADMGITHVIRGEDLINVTPKVLLLREALGTGGEPPLFAHLPLIVNEKRQKLSKRRDDVSVGDYIDRGYLAEAMTNYLATLGWGPPDGVEIRPRAELVSLFRLEDVNKAGAFFDVKKLVAFNKEYLRALPPVEFVDRSTRWLVEAPPWPADRFDPATFERLAPLVQERVETLSEVPSAVAFAFLPDPEIDDDSWAKATKDTDLARRVLDAAAGLLAEVEWAAEAIGGAIGDWCEQAAVKPRVAQAPIRVAVTGHRVGLPLWESIEVLGRDESLRRIAAARARLSP
jgi:glutamyl-tRNA synthetase